VKRKKSGRVRVGRTRRVNPGRLNPGHREIEIKLELDERVYSRILEISHREKPPVLQENTFFDTDDGVLSKKKWAFRIRRERNRYLLSVKGPQSGRSEGIYDRLELESPIPSTNVKSYYRGFDLSQSDLPPCVHLKELFGDLRMRSFLSFTNLRNYVSFSSICMELDKTEIGRYTFYELEVETAPERIARDEEFLRNWFRQEDWPYRPSKLTKLKRALQVQLGQSL
jgi:uncharacterized protein YjbK